MDPKDFASLRRGLDQVKEYQAGAREGFVVHEPVDVQALRKQTKLSQAQFARTYGVPLGTLRDWEQKRRQPDAPARALLTIIAHNPELAAQALA